MVKKLKKAKVYGLFKEFLEKSSDILIPLLEKNINLTSWIKGLVDVKSKIRKHMTFLILSTAGLAVFLFGLSSYLASLIPALNNGLSQIIIGVIIIIISLIIHKT